MPLKKSVRRRRKPNTTSSIGSIPRFRSAMFIRNPSNSASSMSLAAIIFPVVQRWRRKTSIAAQSGKGGTMWNSENEDPYGLVCLGVQGRVTACLNAVGLKMGTPEQPRES